MTDSEKQPNNDVFKSELVKNAYFSPVYEFPIFKRVTHKPEKAVPFDKAARSTKFDHWVHFYIHDKQFERIWNNPKQYLGMLKKFAGVITPDFSLYRALPLAMQIWNTYRNRAIAYWLQSNGIKIVPNIRWGDWRTYPFAFEGIECGGTVAVSTNGCIQKKIDRYYFTDGLERMLEILQPDTVINYSYTPNDIFDICKRQGVEVIQIENFAQTVRRGKA